MSTNQALESTIQITRIVRTGLDIALLLAIVGLFIHLTNLSDSHNTNLQRKKYLASILSNKQSSPSGNNSAEHLEEFHDSEESMWTSFFAWQSKTNYASGTCPKQPCVSAAIFRHQSTTTGGDCIGAVHRQLPARHWPIACNSFVPGNRGCCTTCQYHCWLRRASPAKPERGVGGLSRQRSKSESLSAVFCHSRSACNQPGLAFI